MPQDPGVWEVVLQEKGRELLDSKLTAKFQVPPPTPSSLLSTKDFFQKEEFLQSNFAGILSSLGASPGHFPKERCHVRGGSELVKRDLGFVVRYSFYYVFSVQSASILSSL